MSDRKLNNIVPEEELDEQFVRASGPGGQHVNKTSSAVQLRWNIERSTVSAAIKRRFRELYGSRITLAGDVIIEAADHRSQHLNRQAARRRLGEMLEKASKPKKKRIATRPSSGAVKERLKKKKIKGELKKSRGRVRPDTE
ncbi:MAG: alternative ribosome rescue aminoacyl-tRNA hydrolase ArfB [Pseudomonadota bacterium]